MKVKLLKALSLLVALVMVVALAACGQQAEQGKSTETKSETTAKADDTSAAKPAEKVKLRLFTYTGEDSRKIPHEYAMEQMKKLMPEVEIEFEARVDDNLTKIKSYAATGNLPDIFESEVATIEAFKKSNNIMQLDKYIKDMKVEDAILPSVKPRLYNADGHIYAMPMDGQHVALLFYNKKVFADSGVKVPTNYDEFLTAVKAFSSKNIVPVAFFAKEKWPGIQFFDMLATRMEPAGLTKIDKGNGTIDEPAYKYAADKMYELVKAGIVAKGAFNTDYNAAYALFKESKAAMLLNGSWAMADLAKDMGENVDYLQYPLADAATTESAKFNMAGGNAESGHSVAASTKYPDVAAKWLILYSEELSKGSIIKTGSISTLLKEKVEPETPYAPIQIKYVNDLPNQKSVSGFPWTLANVKLKTALEDNIAKLMTGQYTPDQFMKDMANVK